MTLPGIFIPDLNLHLMRKPSLLCRVVRVAGATVCVMLPVSSMAVVYSLDSVTGILAVDGRGAAGSTWFGWETFNDAAARNQPIDDSTPDIGSAAGVRFRTTNGEDHVLGSGNYYLSAGNPAEEVTVVTAGIPGTGFTTIILQAVTAFDDFPAPWRFPAVNGVNPAVTQGKNALGFGQLFVRYDLPGNESGYVIPFGATGPHFSMDRFVVDTRWNPTGFGPDLAVVPEPGAVALGTAAALLSLRRRRS